MEPPQRIAHAARSDTRALVAMAWPITLSGLSFAVMGVVDSAFVGSQGASELAGVGIGAVVTTGLMGFGFGLLRGVKLLLAQTNHRRSIHYARAVTGAGIYLALGLGALMLVLGELIALVIPQFAASAEAGKAARTYIAVRSLGAPIILLYVALREARYGLDDTRSPLRSSILGNLAHAGLDFVALMVLGLGALGAALANVLAFTLQTVVLWSVFARGSISLGGRARELVGDVLRAGAFTGLQWALEIGALALLALLVAGLGDSDMAAHQIAVQLTAFSFLPALAIAEATSVMAAQAVGAGQLARVPRIARAALRLALGYALVCGAIFTFAGEWIARGFSDDPALIAVAQRVLAVAALHQVLEAAAIAGHGVLRGVGAQRLSALCAVGSAWLFLPIPALLFTRVWSWGAPGGWVARIVEVMATLTFVWWQIERREWLSSARRVVRAARRARGYVEA